MTATPAASAPTPPAVITGIVDIHHDDGGWDLETFKASGGVAIISKATEGGDFKDKSFAKVMDACKAHGLKMGAYHYANGKTAVAKQVRNFLDATAAYPHALKVLDWENNERSSFGTMTLEQAIAFVQAVREATGRWPVFYGYTSMMSAALNTATAGQRDVLANCPLWQAQYGERPRAPRPWVTQDLWQYTDGPKYGPRDQTTYPRSTAGFVDPVQDRSAWFGGPEALDLWWKSAGLPGYRMPSSRP